MLNWIETIKELPEVGEVKDYSSSGVVLGWDGDENCPYIPCMYEEGEYKDAKGVIGTWKHWVGSFDSEWIQIATPEYWAEVNPPK